MPAEFEFRDLIDFLGRTRPQLLVFVVTRDDDQPFRVAKLAPDQELMERVVRAATTTLASLERNRRPEPYRIDWTPPEDELPITPVRDRTLLSALDEALGDRVTDVPMPTNPGERAGIALVAVQGGQSAYLIQRRPPLQVAGNRRILARLVGNQLSALDEVFIYNGGVDLAVWGSQVAIASLNAYEDLFFSRSQRWGETEVALRALQDRVPLAQPELIADLARRDSRFARSIRRAVAGGVLDQLDADKVRANAAEWGLEGVRVRRERIEVDDSRGARWQFLRLLGDDYLISGATGRRYEVNSKRPWPRRAVERVTVTDGVVTAVSGRPWGSATAGEVLTDLAAKERLYYIIHEDLGVLLVTPAAGDDGGEVLWAGPDENLLLSLPTDS